MLATQHYEKITAALGPLAEPERLGGDPLATGVTLLTGSMSVPARRRALLDIASGASGIVVGTHALIQENVQFADLGLAVVDSTVSAWSSGTPCGARPRAHRTPS